MKTTLREDCSYIVEEAIAAVRPDAAVERALAGRCFGPGLVTIAVGKAAWTMAAAAKKVLGGRMAAGVVVTKYGYSQGEIEGLRIFEAGHPVPDENSFAAAEAVLAATAGLSADDTVLFLLSGGGSALFESPLVTTAELADITRQLLACGADIQEINTLRKRFSKVKGGRFALHCAPAKVFSIVLSDVAGDRLDMIASGPACPDSSTARDAKEIAAKYSLRLTPKMAELLEAETPKKLVNVETVVTGSVKELCKAAAAAAQKLGYEPALLTDCLCCEAREAGSFLASVARSHADGGRNLAFIAGGETVVHLTGGGQGGRNQELALAAAECIQGLDNAAVFSFGSDGTDGPTDAAGGFADGDTASVLAAKGLSIFKTLADNNAYNALSACGGLIVTGPTGTNVNDAAVALIRAQK